MMCGWRIIFGVGLLLHATSVWGQLSEKMDLSFDGYGTLGVVSSSEDEADFVSDGFDPEGAGATRTLSPEVDSRLGLQVRGEFTPKLSAVVQYVVEQRFDDTYAPELEWANAKYQITPDLSVRAGRMVLPTFMESGHRKVGFALPWVRPPREVYQTSSVTNVDGADVSYRAHLSGVTNTVRALYGRKDTDLAGGGEAEARDVLNISNTVQWGAATVHVGFSTTKVTLEDIGTQPLFDGFRAFGPQGEAVAERFEVDDTRLNVLSVGARYDPGQWFAQGEWVRSESRSFLADTRAWYVSGGYRFGSLTPYGTFSRLRTTSDTSVEGLSSPGAGTLNAQLNQLVSSSVREQSTVSVGVRWDFARNFALKAQYDFVDPNNGTSGLLVNEQPDFRAGQSADVFSLTLDFVF